MATDLSGWLFASTSATSLACGLVLAVRRPLRRWLGAGAAYASWGLVPAVLLGVSLPAPTLAVTEALAWHAGSTGARLLPAVAAPLPSPDWIGVLWIAGAVLMAVWLGWRQCRFRQALGLLRRHGRGLYRAETQWALPAVMGLLRPRIVLPADFLLRYTREERALMLRHERIHLRRGDLHANALAALLGCLYWFNPLLHLAVHCFRRDQELACDAAVMARHPGRRRAYGMAMLKTQLAGATLPLGCHWSGSRSLKARIAMLKQPLPPRRRRAIGLGAMLVLSLAAGFSAWSAQPARPPAESSLRYRVAMQVDVDGERHEFLVEEKAGAPFSVAAGEGAARWRGKFSLMPEQDGRVVVDGQLWRGGEAMARPKRVVSLGKQAAIGVSSRDGASVFRLGLQVDAVEAGPQTGTTGNAAVADTTALDASRLPPPKYPAEAVANRQSGKVVLIVDVGADGKPVDVQVEKAEPTGVFEQAAVAAARQWRFAPAIQDGKPVPGRVRVPIDFAIDDAPQG